MNLVCFLLGLAVGSFINMAVWRVEHGQSILKKQRSFCDFCKKPLKFYDNIPLLSFLAYRGKSRCCGKKLPRYYPVVEVLMGIILVITNSQSYIFQMGGIMLLVLWSIWALLVFEAVFDIRKMMIPDATAIPLIVLAELRRRLLGLSVSEWWNALGAGLFIWLLTKIKIKGRQAMGEGDALLAVFMGLFLGFPKTIVAFYVAFISGAVIGVGLIASKKKKEYSPIPFGPFLIFGTIIAYFWGAKIINLFF
jgi:prepilin signal peptidase PulO-like enzyme (type II secretory pathway)